ncbi:hypothetical protein HG530_002733 [Fusarium avenaceum]|nr:hypothetical protein HG530_002733 [Fusarium avenaceum]
MLEKPLMGTVAYPEDILMLNAAEFRPAFGNDGSSTSGVNCFEDCIDHFLRIVENNAAKSDINGSRTGLEELKEIWWWRVLGSVSKEESTDVCIAVRGQSMGLGTKAGDQQYVKGIFSVDRSPPFVDNVA